uniref:Fibroblast growth factor 2 n=1 Tax=Sphaerodactylus townsendi TaxID=933632 RepID=A0ACB8E8G8_9SAUR
MAAGSITTLPGLPDDGGGSSGGAFPPGHFKDPKRLYCKNGGFFLRINPDGRVDGVRENSDPHRSYVWDIREIFVFFGVSK